MALRLWRRQPVLHKIKTSEHRDRFVRHAMVNFHIRPVKIADDDKYAGSETDGGVRAEENAFFSGINRIVLAGFDARVTEAVLVIDCRAKCPCATKQSDSFANILIDAFEHETQQSLTFRIDVDVSEIRGRHRHQGKFFEIKTCPLAMELALEREIHLRHVYPFAITRCIEREKLRSLKRNIVVGVHGANM